MTERRIVGAIISGGQLYRAGDEDAFRAHMRGRDLSQLVARGELVGEWPDLAETPADDAKKGVKKSTTKGE